MASYTNRYQQNRTGRPLPYNLDEFGRPIPMQDPLADPITQPPVQSEPPIGSEPPPTDIPIDQIRMRSQYGSLPQENPQPINPPITFGPRGFNPGPEGLPQDIPYAPIEMRGQDNQIRPEMQFDPLSTESSPFIPRMQDQAPAFGSPEQTGDAEIERYKRMMGILAPGQTEAQDRMSEMLRQQPQRPKIGTGRRIAGYIIGALGGAPAVNELYYGEHGRRMKDWQAQFDPLKELALDERSRNANERMLAGSILSNDMARQKLGVTQAYNEGRLGVAEAGLALRREDLDFRRDEARWKRDNPTLKIEIDDQQNMVGIGPNGVAKYITKPDGTPWKSNELSRTELMRLGFTFDLAVEGYRQAGADRRETIEQTNKIILEKYKDQLKGDGTLRDETPAAKRVRLYTSAKQLANQFNWHDWFTFDDPNVGEFVVNQPKESGDPTQQENDRKIYEYIMNAVYGMPDIPLREPPEPADLPPVPIPGDPTKTPAPVPAPVPSPAPIPGAPSPEPKKGTSVPPAGTPDANLGGGGGGVLPPPEQRVDGKIYGEFPGGPNKGKKRKWNKAGQGFVVAE